MLQKRETKFRGWDGENNRMVFWTLNDLLCRLGDDEYRGERKDCSPFFKWMEYTGAIDDERTEIYEGDIILMEYHPNLPSTKGRRLERYLVVRYSAHGFSAYGDTSDELFNVPYSLNLGGSAVKTFRIVGNIYQNANLLKKEKYGLGKRD